MNCNTRTCRLFDRELHLRLHRNPGSDLFFISLHDDETTCVRAGLDVLAEQGGCLLELTHSGKREITFRHDGQTFRFDPNRMFSERGVRRSLEHESGSLLSIPSDVVRHVLNFSRDLISTYALDEQPSIVSLHNTMGDLDVKQYESGNSFAEHAHRVHVSPDRDPEGFYYVTDDRFYRFFKRRDYNVVLQDDGAVNDGSLSARAAELDLPYVNVEAKLGRCETQRQMIREVYEIVEGEIPG